MEVNNEVNMLKVRDRTGNKSNWSRSTTNGSRSNHKQKDESIRPTILTKSDCTVTIMRPLKLHNPNEDQQSIRVKLAATSPSLSPSPLSYTRHLTPTPTASDKLAKLNLNTSSNNNSSVQTPAGITPSSSMHMVKETVASSLASKLATGPFMNHAVKVLDESLGWHDGLGEFLQEQSDFLVVGVLGKQGVGKSTLMSMLAGNRYHDDERTFVFKSGARSSVAVQAFVSAERTIWLDLQPLLSANVLEKAVKSERKHVAHEYYENLLELQSIELACFLMAVCHVVVLVEDWFMDANLMRILQTAEMLAPSLQLLGAQDEFIERKPHLVYVLNKSEFVCKKDVDDMKKCVDRILRDFKLQYKGSICEFNSHLGQKKRINEDNVNFVLLPRADCQRKDGIAMSEFNGVASFEKSIRYLQREILGVRRHHFTNNPSTFTEKKWFAYAGKMWKLIQKSTLIGEYNRLMT